MSIYNKHDPFGTQDGDPCSFCGDKMSHGVGGLWMGHQVMFCCIQCARNVLPVFLADSLYAKNLGQAQTEIHGRVMATLQRALASRAEWRNWNGMELDHRMNLRAERARAEDESHDSE